MLLTPVPLSNVEICEKSESSQEQHCNLLGVALLPDSIAMLQSAVFIARYHYTICHEGDFVLIGLKRLNKFLFLLRSYSTQRYLYFSTT